MHQVLQSGLLGQVFLLWLNVSASIRNLLKEVRLKLSVPLITASQEAPWQKAKVWEHRRAQRLSRRSRSRDRLLFDSRSQDALQACKETQHTRSSLVLTFIWIIVLPGDRVARCHSMILATKANSAQCSLYYHTAFWVFPQEAQWQ